MKRLIPLAAPRIAKVIFMTYVILIAGVAGVNAQERQSVTGKLINVNNNQAVSFASVALIKATDSAPVSGTLSDENGVFTISPVAMGNYKLFISVIGYKPITRNLIVNTPGVVDAGTILLQDTAILINETVIFGEKVKAKSENGKTTFFTTKKLLDASATGADVLKFIPGVQIDLMQNISLEGSRNIQLFVDGKEWDGSFVSQINPDHIDRVEIINKPASDMDGSSTGAINIILKKERISGIFGQIYAEIPASVSQIFLRPSYSLNCGYNKLNVYTSYKGELTYLDLHEETLRKQFNDEGTVEINSNQYVKQKNWSHRFNYGFDYLINNHNQLNFYSFYNPFSRELDGTADSRVTDSIPNYWKAKKEDTDRNQSSYYSLYYKHDFAMEGRALTFEISNFNLTAENSTEYLSFENDNMQSQINTVKPKQNEAGVRIDYTSPIRKKFKTGTGFKAKYRRMQDRNMPDFNYTEEILAAYFTIGYNQTKYDINIGGRAEKALSVLENNFNNSSLSFFPHLNFNYKLTSRQNIQFSYNRSIVRPNIYQLNPYKSMDDPYTISKGNPFLVAELHNSFFLEHSLQFNTNYITSRLFFNDAHDAMDYLTFVNDTNIFETQVNNLGKINQYGIQFSGTIKWGIATLNPYLKIFNLCTFGNNLAKQHRVEDRHKLAFDSGLSAMLSFKHELSLSMVFQYASPNNHIQSNSFSSALYFVSLEKTFKQKIKIGIVSAIPFVKTFTYQGSEINGPDFYSHYAGKVNVSQPFCWFKFSYQFHSGKSRENINRPAEELGNMPKKGF
jgi:outer membrane receptor protein involved in Fe transport